LVSYVKDSFLVPDDERELSIYFEIKSHTDNRLNFKLDMIPIAQQKLGAYLLKNTIGKLLQDFDSNVIEVQLRKGVITMGNCALDTVLFNNYFQQKGILFLQGKIGFISVQIPWSSLFQESCAMVIEDLDIVLQTTQQTEPTVQSPILSSSFHFADQFKRTELEADLPVVEDSDSLNDLAQIIENIIGKVSVTLKRVTIRLVNANENDVEKSSIVFKIEKICLCDHINQRESIPPSLLDLNDDIISRVVKYLELTQLMIYFERNDTELCLCTISNSFVRLLFSQQEFMDESQHSSVYGMANSVILSDFHIAIQTKVINIIARPKDLSALMDFIQHQKHESVYEKTNDVEGELSMFQLHLNELLFFFAGNESDIDSLSMERIESIDHVKCHIKGVKIENHQSPNFGLTAIVQEFDIFDFNTMTGYNHAFQKWSDFGVLDTSTMFEKNMEEIRDHFEVKFSKGVALHTNVPNPIDVSLKLPRVFMKICYEDIVRWKKVFMIDSSGPNDTVTMKGEPTPLNVSISAPLARIGLVLTSADTVPVPIVDLDRFVFSYNTLLNMKSPKIIVHLARLYFGVANQQITNFRHIFAGHDIVVELTDNRDRSPDSGLNEDDLKLKHKQSRDNTFIEAHSAKSWSDFGDTSSPISSEGQPRPKLHSDSAVQPVLSKIIVHLSSERFDIELDQNDLFALHKLIKVVQKITSKEPPEPSQPSLSLIGNITAMQARVYSTYKTNLFDYQIESNCIDVLLAMNSQSHSNLISFEIWCASIISETIDFSSSSSWRLLNTTEAVPQNSLPAAHFIFSQNDDFEISLRQCTITLLLNNLLFNIPTFTLTVPELSSSDASSVSTSYLQSSMDFVVVMTNAGATYSIGDTCVLLQQEYMKVEGNMIEDSPTQGLEFVTTLASLHITTEPADSSFCQRDRISISELPFVKILSIDTFKLQLRLNKQSLPGVDVDIFFKQLTIETCADSLQALVDFVEKLPKNTNPVQAFVQHEPKSSQAEVDTFEMIEESAYIPEALPGDEFETDWQMNFEEVLSKEEVVIDTITIFPEMEQFTLDEMYLKNLDPVKDAFESEIPDFRVIIHDSDITWKLLPGSHFECRSSTPLPYERVETPQPTKPFVEIHLISIKLCLELFPQETLKSKSVTFAIRDMEVIDRVPASQWRKFMGYKAPEGQEPPRETDSDMLKVKWNGFRAEQGEEYRLSFTLLPLQFHIDQDTLLFLENYFRRSDLVRSAHPEVVMEQIPSEQNPIFFQLCEIDPITIKLDYKPKHINYEHIQKGQFAELINFLHLDGAKIYLNPVTMTGVYGWSRLLHRIESIWLPHVKETQIQNLAGGVQGINSIVNVGSGIADLVLLPIEQFQKDGRIFRGISRGATSFLRATTLESARLGTAIANGAQVLLEQADRTSSQRVSKADAPKDLRQGLEMGFQSINQGIKSAAQVFQNKQVFSINIVFTTSRASCDDSTSQRHY
jgi:hypothetical protein